MLYHEAIDVLEQVEDTRYSQRKLPEKEKITEAIRTIADFATVLSCPKYALHAALWWIVKKNGGSIE